MSLDGTRPSTSKENLNPKKKLNPLRGLVNSGTNLKISSSITVQSSIFTEIKTHNMRVSDERLQEAVNAYIEHGEYKASQILGMKPSSLERLLREARVRGISSTDEEDTPHRPNVLILDIETSLMSVFVWTPGKQYIGPNQIIEDWHTLSWGVKWLFEPEMYSDVITPEEAAAREDKRIIESIWQFLDKADIVIIHNARFDVRKLNARFMYYRIPPPSPYKIIDTLLVMRKEALFSSNKQDELAKKLGFSRKVEHEGYDLWVKCFYADPQALLKMEEYNRGDVLSLEELYVIIRPYIRSHPNMNLFVEGDGNSCPNCGNDKISWMDKFYYTSVNKYSCFRCDNCGAIGRSRDTAIHPDNRIKITSVAR